MCVSHYVLCICCSCYISVEYLICCVMQSESNKVMLCYVMLCYVMLCYVMLCYVMLCYVMSHEVNGLSLKYLCRANGRSGLY